MSSYCIRKILVPLDLSEASLHAMRMATYIAGQCEASIALLYINDPSFSFVSPEFHSDPHTRDIVQALAGSIQTTLGKEPAVLIEEGNVASAIVKEAYYGGYDLIIMGTHGASGYRDGFIGTNTYNVIKYAHCPVLTVPLQKKGNGFKKVLFPVRTVSGNLLRYDILRALLTSGRSSIHLLGLSTVSEQNEQALMKEIGQEAISKMHEDCIELTSLFKATLAVADDILHYASQENCDLIVVTSTLDVTHKPYFIGPNVQKVLSFSKVPVLCIRKVRVTSLI